MAECTYIDGIASSQAIDTAGEVVDLAGLDISSLEGSVFNYEHKSDLPAQIVGKIITAKKIFTDKDCENDRQKYYWGKCQLPFLYVMGRLLDDKKESSREIAALFIDDAQNPDEHPMVGFSVEGAKIDKQGMTITRSIARKVTITNIPANKTCLAEMVPSDKSGKKDDLDDIFKTELNYEIQLFKSEMPMKKDEKPVAPGPSVALTAKVNKAKTPPTVPGANAHLVPKLSGHSALGAGTHLGSTKSGKNVFSHTKINEYHGFSSQDHKDASDLHGQAIEHAKTASDKQHHFDKRALHTQASGTKERHENRFNKELIAHKDKAIEHAKLGKSLDAGSALASPGQLTGGAVLGKEELKDKTKPLSEMHPHELETGKMYNIKHASGQYAKYNRSTAAAHWFSVGDKIAKVSRKSKLERSEWLARAEKEFATWAKKEDFRSFMKAKLPNLAIGEIDSIGQTIALKKSLESEKKLSKIAGLFKSEDAPKYKKGDKVHFPVEGEGDNRSDYRHGTIHDVIPKGTQVGLDRKNITEHHTYHVALDEKHPNSTRHAVGDRYFVGEHHLKTPPKSK